MVTQHTPDGGAPSISGPLRHALRSDRGSALVETAIAVPVLVAVTAMMLWGLGLGATALSLADGARDVARAIARGESSEAAVSRAARTTPNAHFAVSESGGAVRVSLTQVVSIPLPLFDGLELTLRQDAAAAREEATDDPW